MEIQKLTATVRKAKGKGPSRRLRFTGKIPAICYGGQNPTIHLVVDPRELIEIVSSEHGYNSIIQLEIPEEEQRYVIVHDRQIHPVKRNLLHVDFITVDLDKEVEVKVPIEFKGRAIGVQMGGELIQVFRSLPVRAMPMNIPSKIEIDISSLELGQSINAASIQIPEGIKMLVDPQQTVVSVGAPKKEAEEEAKPEGEEEEGEEAAKAEGEEGAKEGEDRKEAGDKQDRQDKKDRKDKKE